MIKFTRLMRLVLLGYFIAAGSSVSISAVPTPGPLDSAGWWKVAKAVHLLKYTIGEKVPIPYVIANVAEVFLRDTEQYTQQERLEIAFNLMMAYKDRGGDKIIFDHIRQIPDLERITGALDFAGWWKVTEAVQALKSDPHLIASEAEVVLRDREQYTPQERLEIAFKLMMAYKDTGGDKKVFDLIHEIPDLAKSKRHYSTCGETPLMYAAQWGYIPVLKALLALGADIRVRTSRLYSDDSIAGKATSVLDYGVWSGSPEVVKLLLDHGADAQGNKSCAPLRSAAHGTGNLYHSPDACRAMVAMLLEAGADPFCRDIWGHRALDLTNDEEIQAMLEKKMKEIEDSEEHQEMLRELEHKRQVSLLMSEEPYWFDW